MKTRADVVVMVLQSDGTLQLGAPERHLPLSVIHTTGRTEPSRQFFLVLLRQGDPTSCVTDRRQGADLVVLIRDNAESPQWDRERHLHLSRTRRGGW